VARNVFAAIYIDFVADKEIIKAISEGPNSEVPCIIVSDVSRRNNTTREGNRITSETPRTSVDTYLYIHSLLAAMEIPR